MGCRIITKPFMEKLEVKAINYLPTPCLWPRFVDDTFIIQLAEYTQKLLQPSSSQDPHIPFTTEEPNQDGSLPFLDTLVSPGLDSTLTTSVYRKPKHTDYYLHWDSNHSIAAKIFNTLAYRAGVICTNQSSVQQENNHMRKALSACMFPLGHSTVFS